ncbi:MAG: CapA family protein [Candidatus Saccharimonadales bacterium]
MFRPRKTHQMNRRIKIIRYVAALVVLIAALGIALYLRPSNVAAPVNSRDHKSEDSTKKNEDKTSIRLLATGDFIAHDSVNTAAKQSGGSYDYLSLMNEFVPIFKRADIRFCNDPILNGGAVGPVAGYPKFNSPPEFVRDMGKLGCNLVNMASNHSFDFTQANITASVDAWSKQSNMLAYAGQNRNQAEHDAVHYFTINGVKFGFVAYTSYINRDAPVQNDYGVNVYSPEFAAQQIKQAKEGGAQIIIASMRWGTEYSTNVNAEQKQIAQFLADQGVTLVLGHGSHMLQPVTQLTGSGGNTTTVWYSLGNFLNTQLPPETLFNGIAVIDFDTKTHAISKQQYIPIYMHYEWTASQAAAEQISARYNLHLYLLENANQSMIDSQQLKTTIDAQKQRMETTLNALGLNIPLITSKQL